MPFRVPFAERRRHWCDLMSSTRCPDVYSSGVEGPATSIRSELRQRQRPFLGRSCDEKRDSWGHGLRRPTMHPFCTHGSSCRRRHPRSYRQRDGVAIFSRVASAFPAGLPVSPRASSWGIIIVGRSWWERARLWCSALQPPGCIWGCITRPTWQCRSSIRSPRRRW